MEDIDKFPAAATENISYNSDYYTNLQLSKQGIELLRLADYMEEVIEGLSDDTMRM